MISFKETEGARFLIELKGLIRYKIIEEGSIYLTSWLFKNERFLRVVIINPDTSTKDFKKLIEVITKIGSKL